VQPAGAKSWAFRYRFNGKPKKLTIGPVYLGKDEPEEVRLDHPNTLAGARKLAGEAALLVAKGIDPAKHKKREKLRRGYGPEMPSCLIGTLLKPSPIYSLKNTPKRTPKSEAGLRQPD
jgi:hypothetical protein